MWSCFAKWGRYANLKEHSVPHTMELATAQKWPENEKKEERLSIPSSMQGSNTNPAHMLTYAVLKESPVCSSSFSGS